MQIKEQDKLEINFVDKESLHSTIYALAEICYLKAEHVRINWQDTSTAKTWDSMGRKIDNLAATIKLDSLAVQGLI